MDKQKQKKLVVSVTAGVLALAITGGLWFGIARKRGEPVFVYEFMNVGMTEYWGDTQESYGPVSSDNIQTVFLSKTQQVTDIKVKEGDTVKKGDLLMTFDTTLSALDLERKRLEVEKLKLKLEDEKKRLQEINAMKPMQPMPEMPEIEPVEPELGPELPGIPGYDILPKRGDKDYREHDGSSRDKAMVCWVRDDRFLTRELLLELFTHSILLQMPDPVDTAADRSRASAFQEDVFPEDMEPQVLQIPDFHEMLDLNEEKSCTVLASRAEFRIIPGWDGQIVPNVALAEGQPVLVYQVEAAADGSRWGLTEYGWLSMDTVQPIVGAAPAPQMIPELQGDLPGDLGTEDEVPETPEPGPADQLPELPELDNTDPEGEVPPTTEQTLPPPETGPVVPDVTVPEGSTAPGENGELPEYTEPSVPDPGDNRPGGGLLPDGSGRRVCVVLKVTEGNTRFGPTAIWLGLEIQENGSYRFFNASGIPDFSLLGMLDEPEEPLFPDFDMGSGMTAGQIAKLREEQKKKIKEAEFNIKMAEADYKIKKRELDDGNIHAQFDGVVVSLLSEEEARQRQKPLMKVSGGGGFYVEGSISELELEHVKAGQEVTVNDWNSGEVYTGKIVSVGDFPLRQSGYGGMNNPNASQYPFKAFVDGSANLQTGSYVNIQYTSGGGKSGIYLENPFLRTENGTSYVYVQGENGRLEKRIVTTGKSLWGNYTEIRSGLTAEDLVAFPYGKNVKPGARTQVGDMSNLYS